MITERKIAPWIFLLLALTISLSTAAALPAQVNNEPLPSLAPMLEKALPGVVNITTEGRVQARDPFFDDPVMRRFFGIPDDSRSQPQQGLGSGVIVDEKEGYILTNNHVIENAEKITVKLHDGRHFTAKVIGTDPDSDIAVIQIEAKNLARLPMADSDTLRVGDFVVAIGSPFGLGQTVTSGIVSALGRSGLGIEGYEDFIQTDASINPGNSGGALVNLRGELVGINAAILSRSGGNIGIGFAIPINMASQLMDQIIKHGEVKRGLLGVQIQDLSPELAKAFGINTDNGAVVTRVVPGSAAEDAGIKEGDVITTVNGKKVSNASGLRNAVGLLRIGSKVKLDVIRDGKHKQITATIAEPELSKQNAKNIHKQLEGTTLADIDENSPLYGQVQGVFVVESEPGSPAWQAGVRKNDVITSVNRQPVTNLSELQQAVKKNPESILLKIRRGSGALFLLLQ